MWIEIGNKLAKFYGNMFTISEHIAKVLGGGGVIFLLALYVTRITAIVLCLILYSCACYLLVFRDERKMKLKLYCNLRNDKYCNLSFVLMRSVKTWCG